MTTASLLFLHQPIKMAYPFRRYFRLRIQIHVCKINSHNFPHLKARRIIRIPTKRAYMKLFPNFTRHHFITDINTFQTDLVLLWDLQANAAGNVSLRYALAIVSTQHEDVMVRAVATFMHQGMVLLTLSCSSFSMLLALNDRVNQCYKNLEIILKYLETDQVRKLYIQKTTLISAGESLQYNPAYQIYLILYTNIKRLTYLSNFFSRFM